MPCSIVHAIAQNYGALIAQNRMSMLEDTGFSFENCKVTGSGALYLVRSWGTFSRVVFAYTYMDKIIIPRGWFNWGDPNREMTVFYGQYKCSGLGSNYAERVYQTVTSVNFMDNPGSLPMRKQSHLSQ